jgi:membrane fusion protein, multidrug efflux system
MAAAVTPRAIVACLAALGLLAACADPQPPGAPAAGGKGPATAAGGAGRGPVPVVTQRVASSTQNDAIEALGTTRANEAVDITAKTGNVVTAIRFKEGAPVARGAVLVELDSAQIRADLAAAEATLAESRSQFNRSRELYTTKVLSAAQLEQIEATLKANEARVAAQRARLADTIIRAPFAGRTGLRRVSLGSLVPAGGVITTLDDVSQLKLDFTLPEAFLSAVKPGLEVSATSVAWPGREFRGRVQSVDSRMDPATRAVTVRATLPNADNALKPGMFLTVQLERPSVTAIVIPEQALVPEQGKLYVYVVQGTTAEKRAVTIRQRRPGDVQVASGLQVGERLVVEGTLRLRPGAAVTEVPAGGGASTLAE